MHKKVVYLGGPIRCVSERFAFGWRETAKSYLEGKDFVVLIPKRRTNETAGEIVGNDLRDIHQADILLMHTPSNVSTWGTPMEIFFGSREGKIVVLWGGNFGPDMSPWLEQHSEAYCDELAEALCFIWKNYSD